MDDMARLHTRKRSAKGAAQAAPQHTARPALAQLEISKCTAGMAAIAPASLWPHETCNEHGGAGWAVDITAVHKRQLAVTIQFTHARTPRGKLLPKQRLLASELSVIA